MRNPWYQLELNFEGVTTFVRLRVLSCLHRGRLWTTVLSSGLGAIECFPIGLSCSQIRHNINLGSYHRNGFVLPVYSEPPNTFIFCVQLGKTPNLLRISSMLLIIRVLFTLFCTATTCGLAAATSFKQVTVSLRNGSSEDYVLVQCTSILPCSGHNQVCIDNGCQCKFGYTLAAGLSNCTRLDCVDDLDCSTMMDPNSRCSFEGTCQCFPGYYLDLSSNECKSSHKKSSMSAVW